MREPSARGVIAQVTCCGILAILLRSLPAQAHQKVAVWGDVVDGLQMSISLDSTEVLPSHLPALTLHVRNVAANERRVLLDEQCGPPVGGTRTNLVSLELKDSSGAVQRLHDPTFCAGGGSRLVVPLPPGAVYSMPLKLDHYRAEGLRLANSSSSNTTLGPPKLRRARAADESASNLQASARTSTTGSLPKWDQSGTYNLQAVLAIDVLGSERMYGSFPRSWGDWVGTVTSNSLEVARSSSERTEQNGPVWGEPDHGLQISISLDRTIMLSSHLPALTLCLFR